VAGRAHSLAGAILVLMETVATGVVAAHGVRDRAGTGTRIGVVALEGDQIPAFG